MKVRQTEAHAQQSMVTCNTKECGPQFYVIIKMQRQRGIGRCSSATTQETTL